MSDDRKIATYGFREWLESYKQVSTRNIYCTAIGSYVRLVYKTVDTTKTEELATEYAKELKGKKRNYFRDLLDYVAASLYAACRERNLPTTLDDVAAASGVGRIAVASCYRLLVNELNLEIPVADPAECLASVASRAKVDPKVEADAREILSRATKAGITAGKYPTGLAASALYLASLLDGEWMTQSSAAEAAGVREMTVRKDSKRLRKVVKAQLERAPKRKIHRRFELVADRSTRVEVPARPLA